MDEKQVFEGGCQCGAVTYRLRGRAINLFVCHCSECQKQSGSAFGMALWISPYEFQSLSGSHVSWTRETPSGQQMTGVFCEQCGSRLFHQQSSKPELISIKPGTIDTLDELLPIAHIWTSNKKSWVKIPESCLSYPTNPPTFEAMLSAWREKIGLR